MVHFIQSWSIFCFIGNIISGKHIAYWIAQVSISTKLGQEAYLIHWFCELCRTLNEYSLQGKLNKHFPELISYHSPHRHLILPVSCFFFVLKNAFNLKHITWDSLYGLLGSSSAICLCWCVILHLHGPVIVELSSVCIHYWALTSRVPLLISLH